MRVFRRVVELHGFTPAARELQLSNGAVSKQIAALEEHLGTQLLTRTTRRVSLTSAGAAYYERCTHILDDVADTEQLVRGATAVPRGLLRVNAPMAFGLLHLTPILPDFLERWPEVNVDLSLTDRFVDLVEEGVDVVVRITPELSDSATLTAQRLARARTVLCASPAYLRRKGTPKTPADLARHDCILYNLSRTPNEWEFAGPGGNIRVPVQGRLSVNSGIVSRDSMLRGLGLGLLPAFYVQPELEAKRLRAVMTDYETRPVGVHAVYQRSRHQSPKLREFIAFLKHHFGRATWALGDHNTR